MLAMDEKITPLLTSVEKYAHELIPSSTPTWLKTLRQHALKNFLTQRIPTTEDENWKYTNLSNLSAIAFKAAGQKSLYEQQQVQKLCLPDEITCVFVNGFLDQKLSSLSQLPAGLTFFALQEATGPKEILVCEHLKKYDPFKESSFISLNHVLNTAGHCIHIADNAVIEKLIHVVHITTQSDECFTAPRSVIILGQSAQATVLETHLGVDESMYLSVPLTDIFLDQNAVLHYCKAQSESLNSYHVGNTRVWQERDSHFDGFSLSNGAIITRNDLDIVSNGQGTSSTLNGFYAVSGTQHVDNHSSMDHRFSDCTSNQLYKGLLNGQSHSVFNGKIFVRKIAQKTNSYQLNKNLILGDGCRVDTKPQLEIFADDVKCTHGATIGQLNEDEVFYLQTRCISKKDAVKLLAHGFVQDILNKIPNPAIVEKLNVLLEPTFAALE